MPDNLATRCQQQSSFIIQVSKYDPDHFRVFDNGNDAYISTAFVTGFNVNKVN